MHIFMCWKSHVHTEAMIWFDMHFDFSTWSTSKLSSEEFKVKNLHGINKIERTKFSPKLFFPVGRTFWAVCHDAFNMKMQITYISHWFLLYHNIHVNYCMCIFIFVSHLHFTNSTLDDLVNEIWLERWFLVHLQKTLSNKGGYLSTHCFIHLYILINNPVGSILLLFWIEPFERWKKEIDR